MTDEGAEKGHMETLKGDGKLLMSDGGAKKVTRYQKRAMERS